MRALVLGGTGFVGRHLAEAFAARGHTVTLFHRGRSNPGVLPDLEHVVGDRTQSLAPLAGRTFGVVVDTSGCEAQTVRALLDTVRDVVNGDARFVWAPDEILLAHDVKPYLEMPFWLPASLGARTVPIQRALEAGLALRPFAQTARDTWAWLGEGWEAEKSVRDNRLMRLAGGMTEARERILLDAVRAAS